MTPPVPNHESRRRAWSDPDAFGSSLLLLLIDSYGTEALGWAPDTIQAELRDDLRVTLDEGALNRLMAAVQVVTSNEWAVSAATFNEVVRALSGSPLVPGVYAPADPDDCAWGLTEAWLLSPPEGLSPQVQDLIAATLEEDGYLTAPAALQLEGVVLNLADRVRTEWSDDPAMLNAVWDVQRSKADELDAMVRERLDRLLEQVESLPLVNGSAQGLRGRLNTLPTR